MSHVYSSDLPFEVEITLKGWGNNDFDPDKPGRPDVTYTIGVFPNDEDQGAVWCDCDHEEQCGEICDGLQNSGDPLKNLVSAFENILVQHRIMIDEGAEVPFLYEDIGGFDDPLD